MLLMRQKGTGSFDRKTLTWRLRNKGIHITVRQLGKRYGVTWQSSTPSQLERETASYWNKYRQELQDTEYEQRLAAHPLRRRIQSIEAVISRLGADNRFTDELDALKAELSELQAVDEFTEWKYHDTPIVPPDIPEYYSRLVKLGLVDVTDDYTVGILNESAAKPQPQQNKSSIIKEVQDYVERYKMKSKSTKSWYNVYRSLKHLTDVTGDIPAEDVTAQHYRKVYSYLNNESYSPNTKDERMKTIKSFLHKVAIDNGLTAYGFIHNKDYTFQRVEGDKEQYTIDQVKIALNNATGDIRTALLLGLNCGFITGDIVTMTPDMISGDYIIRSRDKLKHQHKAIQGSWLMWSETKKSLKFGIKGIKEKYHVFAEKYNLPSHKALRKTTTQVIHDVVQDSDAARLFRCERLHGTHGISYIKNFTPAQVKRLAEALKKVAEYYGLS